MNDANIISGNDFGKINISNEVIAVIIGTTVYETEGVVNHLESYPANIQLLHRRTNFAKGVKVEVFDNVVNCEINTVLEVDAKITEVTTQIQQRVINAIETMLGLEVGSVDIKVSNLE
ncbi:MAG: Asp23/Gls24 family envelope stress response protein [Lachnospirales bacterium]